MRKGLIAVAVATALFAVGAFAAQLSVQSEDVASGSNEVVACADSVDVDFGTITQVADGTWTVTTADVDFIGGDCNNHTARLAIDSGEGYDEVGTADAVDGNSASFTFGELDVADIVGASVVVDGATLTAQLT
jgi:hypothetical protein